MGSVHFRPVTAMTRAWCQDCNFTVMSGQPSNQHDVRLKVTDHVAQKHHTVNVAVTAISAYICTTLVDEPPLT
jgi:hypothetical protein